MKATKHEEDTLLNFTKTYSVLFNTGKAFI